MNPLLDNNFSLTISIDDVNPKKNWRILGDHTEKYLESLNREFGAKFTLFIPANHHGNAKLSDHKQWLKELSSINYLELAAHGYLHQTSDKIKYGEMEFLDIDANQCSIKINKIIDEWHSVNICPRGWRNPGWICQEFCIPYIEEYFKWVALHYEHNHNMKWNIQTIFGADSIEHKPARHHNGTFMLQSHIFGDWNTNTWNDINYQNIRKSLTGLTNNYKLIYKTISEVLI